MLILRGLQMGNFGQKTAKRGVGLQVLILQGLRVTKWTGAEAGCTPAAYRQRVLRACVGAAKSARKG